MSYHRSLRDKEKLIKLVKETGCSYLSPVWYNEEKGRYIKLDVPRKERKKFLKKLSNRIVRRSKDNLKNSQYKKIYDLWWELY